MVDDHEVVRQGIRNMLEQTEEISVVGEAGDGEAAIEQILAAHPDVVLMDIQMPKQDGVETVRKLRELSIDTPVILLSVYDKDEYIFDGLRAGAKGYLMKDVGRADLIAAIKTVYGGGSLLQPIIANRLVERMAIDKASGLSERQQEVLELRRQSKVFIVKLTLMKGKYEKYSYDSPFGFQRDKHSRVNT